MSVIKVDFRKNLSLYKGRHIEIRLSGSQIRFYECITLFPKLKGTEICLKRETVEYLLRRRIIPRTKIIKQALQRDKSIFNN